MMWKDSYLLGVGQIDRQHKELFEMVEGLLYALNDPTSSWAKKKFIKVLSFMKNYVIRHFEEEEKFQESIGYPGLEEHKLLHKNFVSSVLAHEKRIRSSDFAPRVVKDFAGTLTAWLIFHVADADQRIVGKHDVLLATRGNVCKDNFKSGSTYVFATMTGADPMAIRNEAPKRDFNEDFSIDLDVVGNVRAHAVFLFTKKFACKAFNAMTGMEVSELNEVLTSAMAEICNISSTRAAVGMMSDVTAPVVTVGRRARPQGDGFRLLWDGDEMQVVTSVNWFENGRLERA